MFFLMWFLYSNNAVAFYQIGNQYETMELCKKAEKAAIVLITNSKTRLLCFEVSIDD